MTPLPVIMGQTCLDQICGAFQLIGLEKSFLMVVEFVDENREDVFFALYFWIIGLQLKLTFSEQIL